MITRFFWLVGEEVGFTTANFGTGDVTLKLINVAKDPSGAFKQTVVDGLTKVVPSNTIGVSSSSSSSGGGDRSSSLWA